MTSEPDRKPQLAYSELQAKMLDEQHRRTKAGKIISVIEHFLGREDLSGLTALDIGCSAGFIAHELALQQAHTIGIDIDEPGLAKAREKYGDSVDFRVASGDDMPFADGEIDVAVFNHIYEHVVDPDKVVREIHRVLADDGVGYFGLSNKYQIMEPHYRLPFLSWLPQRAADRYVRAFKKSDSFYESFLSRGGMKHMLRGFHVWEYTIAAIRRPDLFNSSDQVSGKLARVPAPVISAGMQIVPTYIWLVTKGRRTPQTVDGIEFVRHMDLTTRA